MIFIDTQLWVFAQKKPSKEKFTENNLYEEFLSLHEKSKIFLSEKIRSEEIAITIHQLGEIYHSLAFRGDKLSRAFCVNYCEQLIDAQFLHWYPLTFDHIRQCLKLSSENGIHVWDYICVVPLIHDIDEIFSCDIHFQDESFRKFTKSIINPLDRWMTL